MNKLLLLVASFLLCLAVSPAYASGTVVYGFDGTGKNLKNGDKTNVYRFMMAHRAANPGTHYVYAGGVGSLPGGNFQPLNYPGKITGSGGKKIIRDMYKKLVQHFKSGRKEIVIVGFSRGAALSREFAHLIQKRGDPLQYQEGKKPKGKAPKIKFMALFDTVYSFGIAAGKTDLGFHKRITSDVKAVAHATATLELRNTFDLWSIHFDKKHLNSITGSVKKGNLRAEKAFEAGHDDVGGAKKYNYYGYDPLVWVIDIGKKTGLTFVSPKKSDFKKQKGQEPEKKGLGKRQIYFPKRGKVPAITHKKAKKGCKGKQIYLSGGACYSCPKGYRRFSPTRKMTHPKACTKRGWGNDTKKATYKWQANGCPKNQFKHKGYCKKCPAGTKRIHVAGLDTGFCK
ncbi:hypothetical protein NBRC116587_26770 [Pseudoteredinibacter isoporae]